MPERHPAMIHMDLDRLLTVGAVSETSDGELLERFIAGRGASGEAAFEEIVRRHGPMVLGVCRRILSDRQAAEDAFQATFLVLALRASSIRERASVGPWLHGVAARVARRAASSRRRRREFHLADETEPSAGADEPSLSDLRSVLDEELGRLPEKYRRPVILCYLEGQTQEEAARALGWTKGTVSGRLARAKDLLRGRLVRRGLAPASASALLAAFLAPGSSSAAVLPSVASATARSAVALGLAGAEAGLASGQVLSLARAVVRSMVLLRVRGAVTVLLLSLGGLAGAAYGLWTPDERLRANGRPLAAATQRPVRLAQPVVGVGFLLDGRTAVSANASGLVQFWDASGGGAVREVELMQGEQGEPSLAGFVLSSDGRLMAGAGSIQTGIERRTVRGVWLWSVEPLRMVRRFETGERPVEALAFSPEGASLATGESSGRIRLWDVASGEELLELRLGEEPIRGLAFSPDGMTLAATNESSGVQLWDLGGGRPMGPPDSGSDPRSLGTCFSADGRLLGFASPQGEVTILDRVGRRPPIRASLDVQGPLALGFAPDGRALAVNSPSAGILTVIDPLTGRERWTARLGSSSGAGALAYSADGRSIVLAGDAVPRFVDAGTGFVQPAR